MSFKDQDWKVIGNAEKNSNRPKVHFETPVHGDECWCVETVKNKTLITRHNGKVTVMGNCVGRCLRLDPDNPDKIAYILDLSGNVDRFGKVEDIKLSKVKKFKYNYEYYSDAITLLKDGKRKIWDQVS